YLISRFSYKIIIKEIYDQTMNNQYFMFKELSEVPSLIRQNLDCFEKNTFFSPDFNSNINHIKFIASGSSNNVALAGKYLFEELCNIETSLDFSSEFVAKKGAIKDDTLAICISQSGKTADTLSALNKIKQISKSHILAITNIKDSPIFNEADSNVLIGAGEEKAIPATKTFSLQLLALFNIALKISSKHNSQNNIYNDLNSLPELLNSIFILEPKINEVTEKLFNNDHLTILSNGINFAISKEGALKFKETSYIDSNGYPVGEFMHGYMALLDKKKSVLVLDYDTNPQLKENILKLKEKSEASIFALTMNSETIELYDDHILLPSTKTELVSSFIFASCLQLMAFYGACILGYNPDKPRGLTKYLN
ncbi:MAG: SIS domain-containing protein, partial [Cyanobacteriota bacterium]